MNVSFNAVDQILISYAGEKTGVRLSSLTVCGSVPMELTEFRVRLKLCYLNYLKVMKNAVFWDVTPATSCELN
jgi:hypothetical protein